ncbi:ABC transporter ATP-binding protein [Streptomyces sp. NPDC059009]|uniref:ABC transporter ATP-binding protein n=1 Tax=Streptomyces sp. NPDC059009 TaxID=3346694 RepID=UPI003674A5E5
MSHTAIEAAGLTKRYGRRGTTALEDCSFRLPLGRICALVGPNGSGKSTLLGLVSGRLRPTGGTVTTLGCTPEHARRHIAYVAQDKPLYPQLTIAETLRLGAELNPDNWDMGVAEGVIHSGDLDPDTRVRALSGGHRTLVALALALGKKAELLLLDEPMADLDPLARRRLMGALLAEAARHGTTVVMSSHILGELADSCDYLLLVSGGRILLGGGIDDLVNAHALVTGPGPLADLARHTIVESRATGRGLRALIRPEGPPSALNDGDGRGRWDVLEPSLEELVLTYLRCPDAPSLISPSAALPHQNGAVTA